ncbi:abscisic acid 8'-hydroxylase 4-like [Cryptomeria japonica]|uniref:abscisic acid 8'-hydroxylase 4-like n=1 Tax=Cryptomeria japonica TaxID=3369 RepID=UPI0025ABCFC2|nr:abscisic acid 8'-hydroxylase 4-like [Cryptomeria japonica]
MAEMWKLVALQIVFPLMIVVLYVLLNLRRKGKRNDGTGMVVPGCTGFPIVGESLSFFSSLKSPTGVQSFTEKRAKLYGRTFMTNILGNNRVFTSEREAVKFIWSTENSLFRFAGGRATEGMFGKNSLFYAGADVHKKMRKLVGEPLSKDILKKNFEQIEAICLDVLDGWSGKTVSAMDGTSSFAFQIISYITASIPKGPELSLLHKRFTDIINATGKFAINIPGTAYYKGHKARKHLMASLDTIIDRRRKGDEMKDDFIQSMVSRDGLPPDERLSDMEIKDNCLVLLLAGHATTGATLTWAMKYLEDNPEAKEALMAEYKKIQGKKDKSRNSTNLTWDDISDVPYTLKVIFETLRMSNPAPWICREALQDTLLQGYFIKKNWNVTIDGQALHCDPDLFENPTKFNPSRFNETPKPYSFVGFGGGLRTCLGVNLAKWKSVSNDNTLSSTFIKVLKNGYLIQVEPK